MRMMSKSIIVFDLDGTLVDTAPDLLAALNFALVDGGISPVDPVAHRPHLGFGGRVMIERAFQTQRRDLPNEKLAHLLSVFLQHYSDNIPGASAPFPGATAALDRFQNAGWLLAICTNKTEKMAKALMAGLNLEHLFGAICGQDTFPFRKPDPRHLTETIRLAGGDPAMAVMVGDSHADIDAAKAAGIPVVAVDFGYTDRHVREFEPSSIISHFDELSVELANTLLSPAR
jgi:phosphoglycolate phosphatase